MTAKYIAAAQGNGDVREHVSTARLVVSVKSIWRLPTAASLLSRTEAMAPLKGIVWPTIKVHFQVIRDRRRTTGWSPKSVF